MKDPTVVVVDLLLDRGQLERCATILDSEETARADRFLRAQDRARFIASHASLRLILGRALGVGPATLSFTREGRGRPSLRDAGGLDFNLSHSGDRALVGVVFGARIGVDIEARRPMPDALRIARGHFARDEAEALAGLPADAGEHAFFDLWTRKEAVVKATGEGLSMPLAAFSVTVPPQPPRFLRSASGGEGWTLRTIEAGPDYAATAAVTTAGASLHTKHLAQGWTTGFDAK